MAIEDFVVFGDAVVDVDERAGDVAVGRVRVVGRELLGLLVGGWILRNKGFLKLGDVLRAAVDEFDEAFFRRGEKHGEGFDVGIEAEFLVLGQNPFGVFLVVGRADIVRAGAQTLHVGAEVGGARRGAEFFFPLAFGARGLV